MARQKKSLTGIWPKGDAGGGHAFHVEAQVLLLVAQGAGDAAAEAGRGVGELQQHQGHQLRRHQLVVGEEVQDEAAVLVALEGADLLKGDPAGLAPAVQGQLRRSPRGVGGLQGASRPLVGQTAGGGELVLQGVAEEDGLGQLADLHAGKSYPSAEARATSAARGGPPGQGLQ